MLNTLNLLCCSSSVDESQSTNVDELVTFTGPVYTRGKTVSNISFLFLTISIWFHRRGIFDSVSQFCFIIWKTFRLRKGDQQAPPSIRRHPSNECIPPAPPLADILNNRLFEEILFGNFSLFHLHSRYHNVTLLPLVTSVQNSLSATYKWNK